MQEIQNLLGLGLEAKELTFWQVGLRATIVFVASMIIFRLADKRFLSRITAFDAILGFILGSMISRAVNGSAPFFPTLGGGLVLVLLHRAVAWLAFHWPAFADLVEGQESLLIRNGNVNKEAMRSNHITEKDLLEELRQEGQVQSPAEVKIAFLERSGKISVVRVRNEML